MHTEKGRSPLVSYQARRHRTEEATLGVVGAGDLAEEDLARGPDEHGEAEFDKITEAVQEL